MQPAHAPSEPDNGQKHGPYEGTVKEIVKKLEDQGYLFVVAIAIVLVGLASLAAVLGTPDLRFIAILIAFLAFSVIIVSFAAKFVRVEKRQDLQQEIINRLVTLSMSPSVFRHLVGVMILKDYLYRENYEVANGKDEHGEPAVADLFKREFYYLKDHGFIGPPTLEFARGMHKTNIAGVAIPTPLGWTYLKLRKGDILKDEECKKWLDPNIPTNRKNLNVDAVKDLGLKVNDDGTISDS